MSQLISYEYENQVIEFDVAPDSLMINATEMAKLFDRKVEDFTRLQRTKDFITAFIKNENQRFISEEKNGISRFLAEDLITSTQKSGTWMHRVLALKFAAWLDPEFEVWVYNTIDDLIFGEYKRLKNELTASAKRKQRIEELEMELGEDEQFREWEELKKEERRSAYRRGKVIKNQLQLFKEQM